MEDVLSSSNRIEEDQKHRNETTKEKDQKIDSSSSASSSSSLIPEALESTLQEDNQKDQGFDHLLPPLDVTLSLINEDLQPIFEKTFGHIPPLSHSSPSLISSDLQPALERGFNQHLSSSLIPEALQSTPQDQGFDHSRQLSHSYSSPSLISSDLQPALERGFNQHLSSSLIPEALQSTPQDQGFDHSRQLSHSYSSPSLIIRDLQSKSEREVDQQLASNQNLDSQLKSDLLDDKNDDSESQSLEETETETETNPLIDYTLYPDIEHFLMSNSLSNSDADQEPYQVPPFIAKMMSESSGDLMRDFSQFATHDFNDPDQPFHDHDDHSDHEIQRIEHHNSDFSIASAFSGGLISSSLPDSSSSSSPSHLSHSSGPSPSSISVLDLHLAASSERRLMFCNGLFVSRQRLSKAFPLHSVPTPEDATIQFQTHLSPFVSSSFLSSFDRFLLFCCRDSGSLLLTVSKEREDLTASWA